MSDYDSPWKEALDLYFRPFLAIFFPLAHADIDWSRRYELLDKELQGVTRDAELGRRYADMLVKVWLKDGSEYWLLIHVEIHGRYEAGFGKRIYVYNHRVFDKYDREVVSLVVLADDDPNWRPRGFHTARWGCKVGIDFEPVKLLDYAGREAELEASDNPFAKMLLAHLKTLETRGNDGDRYAWKVRLVRNLYECGLSADDVRELFRLIDWMMDLPPALDDLFWEDADRIEKEKHMPFIDIAERKNREKGQREGLREGLLKAILLGFKLKFPGQSQQLYEEVRSVEDPALLQRICDAIETAAAPDELRRVWTK
jgi:hypothetical protein